MYVQVVPRGHTARQEKVLVQHVQVGHIPVQEVHHVQVAVGNGHTVLHAMRVLVQGVKVGIR